MNRIEQIAHRRATKAFIEADVHDLRFTRPVKNKNQRGGKSINTVQVMDSQRVHLGRYTSTGSDTATGQSGSATYYKTMLVGEYNLDIEVGDYFTADGVDYYVEFIEPDREYQTRARLQTGQSG